MADVNRRVEHTRQEVERSGAAVGDAIDTLAEELGAYATTAAEASSLVGVELRRVEEAIEALSGHIDEHESRLLERVSDLDEQHYVGRIQRATELPLERLDGAIANLINHASGHRGYAAQAGLWFNPPVTVELSEGSAALADVNERIVEIPFAMRMLARLDPPAQILDVGAAESTFSLSAAALGYQVTALDLHPVPYTHPLLKSIVGRFEDWDAAQERFDAVFLISTIEHVGLGAYGEPIGSNDADVALVTRVRKELLSDCGFLVLTTPYGTPHQDAFERTYDDDRLERLLDGWNVVERRVVLRRDKHIWMPSEENETAAGGRGVVMILATPASRS